jgi:hypothetical protein
VPDIKDITNAITYAEILLLKLYIASLLVNHICPLKAVRTVRSPHGLSRDSGMTRSFGFAKTRLAGQNILKWTAMPGQQYLEIVGKGKQFRDKTETKTKIAHSHGSDNTRTSAVTTFIPHETLPQQHGQKLCITSRH